MNRALESMLKVKARNRFNDTTPTALLENDLQLPFQQKVPV